VLHTVAVSPIFPRAVNPVDRGQTVKQILDLFNSLFLKIWRKFYLQACTGRARTLFSVGFADAPHSHLCFVYKMPVSDVPLDFGWAAAKDSATLNKHTNHSINTCKHSTPLPLGVYIRALVVPSFNTPPHQRCSPSLAHPSPKSFRLWSVRKHHIGWRLVGRTL